MISIFVLISWDQIENVYRCCIGNVVQVLTLFWFMCVDSKHRHGGVTWYKILAGVIRLGWMCSFVNFAVLEAFVFSKKGSIYEQWKNFNCFFQWYTNTGELFYFLCVIIYSLLTLHPTYSRVMLTILILKIKYHTNNSFAYDFCTNIQSVLLLN